LSLEPRQLSTVDVDAAELTLNLPLRAQSEEVMVMPLTLLLDGHDTPTATVSRSRALKRAIDPVALTSHLREAPDQPQQLP
jgi:hypothetical protein